MYLRYAAGERVSRAERVLWLDNTHTHTHTHTHLARELVLDAGLDDVGRCVDDDAARASSEAR